MTVSKLSQSEVVGHSLRAGREDEGRRWLEEALATPEGRRREEELRRWAGRDVETVKVEAVGHYKGPAGLSGLVRTWISRDGRAIPCKASIKVALGSVVLTLRHVLQTAALWPFYRAGRRLHDRGRGGDGQRPSFSRKTALSRPASSRW